MQGLCITIHLACSPDGNSRRSWRHGDSPNWTLRTKPGSARRRFLERCGVSPSAQVRRTSAYAVTFSSRPRRPELQVHRLSRSRPSAGSGTALSAMQRRSANSSLRRNTSGQRWLPARTGHLQRRPTPRTTKAPGPHGRRYQRGLAAVVERRRRGVAVCSRRASVRRRPPPWTRSRVAAGRRRTPLPLAPGSPLQAPQRRGRARAGRDRFLRQGARHGDSGRHGGPVRRSRRLRGRRAAQSAA